MFNHIQQPINRAKLHLIGIPSFHCCSLPLFRATSLFTRYVDSQVRINNSVTTLGRQKVRSFSSNQSEDTSILTKPDYVPLVATQSSTTVEVHKATQQQHTELLNLASLFEAPKPETSKTRSQLEKQL